MTSEIGVQIYDVRAMPCFIKTDKNM